MKSTSRDTTKKKVSETASFEESLAELQEIVAALEDGEIGLDESMRKFEAGVALLRSCYQTLEQAEQKIEILTGRDADGNITTQPFDASATAEQSSQSAGKRRRKTKTSSKKTSESDTVDRDNDKQSLF